LHLGTVDAYVFTDATTSTVPRKATMIFVRLLRALREADARRREQDWITSVIHGPETAFRSELVEVLSRGTK
jgi:hypothetical protein